MLMDAIDALTVVLYFENFKSKQRSVHTDQSQES